MDGAQDFYEGSLFFLGDEGVKNYDRFVAFPKELSYRLYARDRNKNETYVEFTVQGTVPSSTVSSTSSASVAT